jgi:geranylgeranyl diphosphate synthase type I
MTLTQTVTQSVEGYLRECAGWVDREILSIVDSQVDDAWLRGAIGYHFGWADRDFEAVPPHARLSSGKKLRPALALLCYQGAQVAQGGDAGPTAGAAVDLDGALVFAAALECIHNFSLVHDDIEDGDRWRRGRPTLWSVFGPEQAINAGDCLHSLGYACLGRLRERGVDGAVVAELATVLAGATLRMIAGQRRDMSYETESDVDSPMYLEMIAGKTAALIACATYGGALLALHRLGESAHQTLDGYADFGRHLGLSFQIRDDILGTWGAEDETGKPQGRDIRRRKKTLPVVFAFQESSIEDRGRLQRLYAPGDELTDGQEQDVRGILEHCRAEAFSQQQGELHAGRALQALTMVAGGAERLQENPFLAILEQLTGFVTARTR